MNVNVLKDKFLQIKKRTLIIISCVLLLGLVFWVWYVLQREGRSLTATINAVPTNAAVIIETRNLGRVLEFLKEGNDIWNALAGIPAVNGIDQQVSFLDSLFRYNSTASRLIKNKPFVISLHIAEKEKLEFLYFLGLPTNSDQRKLKSLITELSQNQVVVSKREFEKAEIFTLNSPESKKSGLKNFSYTVYKGVFIASASPILLEQAIKQSTSKRTFNDDADFRFISKTAGKDAKINIFLNYQQLPKFCEYFFNEKTQDFAESLKNFATWTEVDLTAKSDEINFLGFTSTSKNSKYYVDVLQSQSPRKSKIIEFLPTSTSVFATLILSDVPDFIKDFRMYTKNSAAGASFEADLEKWKNNQFQIDKFFDILENEAAILQLAATEKISPFVIFKTIEKVEAEKKLKNILTSYAKTQKESVSDYVSTYKTNVTPLFTIYQLPTSKLPQKMFGGIFSEIDVSFVTFVNDFLVFAQTKEQLHYFINEIELQQKLIEQKEWKSFFKSLTSTSNFTFFSNLRNANPFFLKHLNKESGNSFVQNNLIFQKFQGIALQFGATKGMVYTNFHAKFIPETENKNFTVWETHLDTIFTGKPQIISSAGNFTKDIFVQDEANRLYLMDEKGRILWKKDMNEKIVSKISQIDYFRNDRSQIVFSTTNYIYILDRNGKNLENFPLQLPAAATNGVTVFDYEKNKNYRLFIACDDKKIHAYSLTGKSLRDWKTPKTEAIIVSDIQYFRNMDKDYLVFTDLKQTYIANRRGEIKVKVTSQFKKSANNDFYFEPKTSKSDARLVATNTAGAVHFIYFDGNIRKLTIKPFSQNHYFYYLDINDDGFNDFVFVDNLRLEAYNRDKSLVYSYNFDEKVVQKPILFTFPRNEKKIGVLSGNQIFLFNSDGSLYKGFPMLGETPFSISYFENTLQHFNLIVGKKTKVLCNYQVHK